MLCALIMAELGIITGTDKASIKKLLGLLRDGEDDRIPAPPALP